MGFPIPEPFIWDTSFKVFYQEIDAEHQGLFEGIFAIGENPGSQLAIDNAYAVFNNHFIHEQGAMNASGYKGYREHTDLHNGFLNDFKARFNAPVASETMNWAKDWLVNHIKTIDFKYKGKLTTIV